MKNNDIKDILNYLENEGSHVVLKGLSLKEKDKMISKLYKRGDGKFRIDLDSFMAINEKHGERDDQLTIPTYLSMANIGGEIKLSYGISYLTFDSKKEAKDFAKNLKNENFGPRELLLQQVDMEIDEMLKTDYIEDRLELLQAKDELRSFNKSLTTSGDIIWDDIRVNRTFYFGNWTSGAPTAGKIDGYRFVYKHSDNSSEYDYFSIEGDFTIYDGSRSGGSVGNKLDRYDAGVYLTSTVDEMLKAAPVTDALNLDADKGTNVSFSIDGTGTPSVSISFDWPRDGFHATLDAELTRGNKGSYTFVVNEDNYYDWLPGKFSVNYAAYLKSAGTFLTVDLTQGLSTNAGFYKNVDFYILDQLRNDY